MFIWDFVFGDVMDQILDWIYAQMIGFLSSFFSAMGNMGTELFKMDWVNAVILFFSYLAWALYVTGILVAVFECAIDYQSGRANVKDTTINVLKGFMATSLFTTVPIRLYALSVSLSATLTADITGIGSSFNDLASNILRELVDAPTIADATSAAMFSNFGGVNPIMVLFIVFMMGYAVIKVFFANLKRGGILLIQIAVGSLYMFSVPRGYGDPFVQWCKQVIALCLTAFLQVLILTAGLMVLNSSALLGLGLMLSAGEVPRIAGMFGLDTSTKANLSGAIHGASMAVSASKQVTQLIAR